jgi:hypothetical protein
MKGRVVAGVGLGVVVATFVALRPLDSCWWEGGVSEWGDRMYASLPTLKGLPDEVAKAENIRRHAHHQIIQSLIPLGPLAFMWGSDLRVAHHCCATQWWLLVGPSIISAPVELTLPYIFCTLAHNYNRANEALLFH